MSAWLAVIVAGVAAGLPVVGVVVLARRAERERARSSVAARFADVTMTRHAAGPFRESLRAPRRARSVLEGRWGRWRSRRRWQRDLPLALEAMARELRAGAPLAVALVDGLTSVGGPIATDAVALRRRIDAGQPVADALRWWAASRRSAELEPLAVLCATGSRLGGGLAAAVDGMAGSLQDRREVTAEAAAMSSQARASAVMLVAAPAVFVLVMSGVEPAATRFLFTTPAGWLTLAAAASLDGLGALWMHRLTEGAR